MSKVTPFQKLSAALRLLVGMRHPAVQKALKRHRFEEAVIDQGWDLLLAAGRSAAAVEEVGEASIDGELVRFQQRWFPVARVVLRAHAPDSALYGKLSVQGGLSGAHAVAWFLSQLSALGSSPRPKEREARTILRERGLGDEVEREGHELVRQSARVILEGTPDTRPIDERALDALWTWYLEWQGFARESITNKNLLRALGLAPLPGRPPGSTLLKSPVHVLSVSSLGFEQRETAASVPSLLQPETARSREEESPPQTDFWRNR